MHFSYLASIRGLEGLGCVEEPRIVKMIADTVEVIAADFLHKRTVLFFGWIFSVSVLSLSC